MEIYGGSLGLEFYTSLWTSTTNAFATISLRLLTLDWNHICRLKKWDT